jgi:hypothetical protein
MAVPISYYGVSYYETGTAWKARETGINRDYSAISIDCSFTFVLVKLWYSSACIFFTYLIFSYEKVSTHPGYRFSRTLENLRKRHLSPKNLETFWCTGWTWNCQIIFRFASFHGRACFILNTCMCQRDLLCG